MGQYYLPVVLRHGEFKVFNAHKYNNGVKLMEHSYIENNFMHAVMNYIYEKPTKLWWIGDYAAKDDFKLYDDKKAFEFHESLQHNENNDEYEVNEDETLKEEGRYLINHSKKVYIDLKEYRLEAKTAIKSEPEYGNKIHPLSILTAVGNGRRGGDYEGINMYLVGTWAGDILEARDDMPYKYSKLLNVEFQEE